MVNRRPTCFRSDWALNDLEISTLRYAEKEAVQKIKITLAIVDVL